MSTPAYYKENNTPATRDEMFLYLNSLLYTNPPEAKNVLRDLMSFENVQVPDVTVGTIVIDTTASAAQQLKALFKNPNAWEPQITRGEITKYKVPSAEAIRVMKSLTLTHTDLLAFYESITNQVHKVKLIVHNDGWDKEWILRQHDNRDYRNKRAFHFYLDATTDEEFLEEALSLIADYQSKEWLFTDSNGANLSDTLLKTAHEAGCVSVIADPRFTAEDLTESWNKFAELWEKEETKNFASYSKAKFLGAVTLNPNTPGWLLDAAVPYSRYNCYDLLLHPNTTGLALDELLKYLGTAPKLRTMIANHPNVRASTLKKLAKSATPAVSEAAKAHLETKEKKQVR